MILHSTQKNSVFQHYYHSFCDYLSAMGGMDKQQAVFEQLILSDLKKRTCAALRTIDKSKTIITNNNDKLRI